MLICKVCVEGAGGKERMGGAGRKRKLGEGVLIKNGVCREHERGEGRLKKKKKKGV